MIARGLKFTIFSVSAIIILVHAIASCQQPVAIKTVSEPIISTPSGTYSQDIMVEIVCATEGAIVYYTNDGSEPGNSSQLYTSPILISANTPINAVAYKKGMNSSSVSSEVYLFSSPPTGSGTQGDPYLVSSLEHLFWIACDSLTWDKYYTQVSDINASNTKTWFNGRAWQSIGQAYENLPFTGNYNGADHRIDSLYCNRFYSSSLTKNSVGLFGYTYNAHLSNIRLTNVDVTSRNNAGGLVSSASDTDIENCYVSGKVTDIGQHITGMLAGSLDNSCAVSFCESSGEVSGEGEVGGLVGDCNDSNITDCSSNSAVSGMYRIGGLIGYLSSSALSNSHAESIVGGESNIGGLVGENSCSQIYHSNSSGQITGSGNSIGGMVGYNASYGLIKYCWSDASVSSSGTNTGGLVGLSSGDILNCYSKGTINGNGDIIGGLVGRMYGSGIVDMCYSKRAFVSQGQGIGGLIGKRDEQLSVLASYWDTSISGISFSDGGEGRISQQMIFPYSDNTYVGWDFVNVWNHDPDYQTNSGYPILKVVAINNALYRVLT